VPVIAVSPIIAGAAVKGPTAKMMQELGLDVSAAAVAAHYRGLVTAMVVDAQDVALAAAIRAMGMAVRTADTLMRNGADRRRLAATCLEFAAALGAQHP
jgi:LPPG:FO 2-phospho-L-lactate transferase